MEALIEWVLKHAQHAHWYVFGAILLAGFNIPISADILIVCASFLAASVIPEHLWHLYFAVFFGCYFSAWIAYWFGRLLGKKFYQFKWFSRFFPPQKLDKIQQFYSRHGLLTLLLGRFIPFGVRNCIFMSSGMSRFSFLKFAIWDFFACSMWTGISFYTFLTLGHHYQELFSHLKVINILIFLGFGLAVIGFIWYKHRKKASIKNTNV